MFAIRLPRVFPQPKAFRHVRWVVATTLLLALCGGTFAPTAAANAVPYVDIVSPVSVTPGATSVTLTVLGTGFIDGSVVKWNSTALVTTFVSAKKLTAAVPDSLVAAQGLGTVTVFTPTPLGGTSNVFYVPVTVSEASTVFPSTPSSSVTVGTMPQGIATADLNGDGKLDLIVANQTSGTVTVLLGNGDGTFITKSTPAGGAGANWVAVGDFNEDGIPDLAVADVNSTGAAGVTILRGVGDGTFIAGATLTTGSGPFSITTADFNGDGHLDLAVANANGDSVSVFLGNGDGTFGAATTLAAGTMPQQIVAGDFNEDGNLDLAVTNEEANTVSVFFGTGTGAFGTQHVFSTSGSGFPIGLIAADFNGDGHLDLAAVNASDVAILTNNGAGVFTLTSNPGTGSHDLIAGVAGDYNGDGHLDLVLSDRTAGEAFLLLGNGSGSFGGAVTFTTASGAFGVATADFNGDGALDLAIANGAAGNVSIFLQTLPVNLSPTALAFGNQPVGAASTARTVTFTNKSGVSVTISSIAFTGTDSGDFSSGGTCSTSAPVANNSTCTITVTFTPGAAGGRQATLTVTDSAGNSPQTLALTGTGTVLVPTISKAFGAASIPLNGTTSLSFTISNPAGNQSITGVGFTDAFPAGLLVATPNGLSGTCGAGTITATAGASNINLSGGTLAAGASTCTFQANVVGITAGAQANTTGVISSAETGAGATSNTATVTVISPPVISEAFGAANIPLNGTTSLTFTLSNPNTTTTLSGVGFVDTLPAGLAIAAPNGLTNSCGGTPTATAGTNSVTLSAATLAASGSCTLVVNVTGTTAGTKSNITGAVQSTNGGAGGTASASLAVEAPPTIAKAFGAAAIGLTGATSLTFTITNPAANSAALTGVAFNDTLPAGIVVATPNGLGGTCCGGTPIATAGSAVVALSGTTVATNTSCTLSVNVTATGSGGAVTNTTGNVTSTNGGTGNTATANLGIGPGPAITSANVAAFAVGTAGSFTITASGSPTPSITETGVLPAGVTFLDNGNGTATLSGTPAASGTPGSYTVSFTAHNGNGADATQTFTLTIGKGTPAITWAAPSNITFGAALTTTQLDATSSVLGTYVYAPPLGTVLGAGLQTLSYTFTPTDTTDYNATTGSVVLTVQKATPAITWATPAAIAYGTPLGATQLDATATAVGTFTYTPPAGTTENAGSQTLSVTFTPTDTADYNATTGSVALTVQKATPAITWAAPAAIAYGTPLGATQLDATATAVGTFTYTPPAGTIENAGSQTLSVSFTPTDTADNLASTAQVTLTVNAASTSVTLTASPTTANPSATVTLTVMATSAGGVPIGNVTFFDNGVMLATVPLTAGTATYSTSVLAVGAHTITATYAGNGNFAAGASAAFTETIGAGGFTIVPATAVAVVQAGQAANIPITVLALSGITGQVEFSVAGLPTGATVSFISNPLTLSANPSIETLIIMTQPRFNYLAGQTSPSSPSRAIFTGALCLPIFGMVFGGARFAWRRKRRGSFWLVLLILSAASGMIAGCANRSGFQDSGTPAGSYPLTITAVGTTSSGPITDTTAVLLTVR